MSILWGVKNDFPFTKPMAVNIGLARLCRLWLCSI